MSGNGIVKRRAGAFVGHAEHAYGGAFEKQLGREMNAAAGSA